MRDCALFATASRPKAESDGKDTMTTLSSNAQLVSTIFEEVAKGNGAPFWEACHEDIVWRTIGEGSWSGEFVGKQTIIDEIFRPLNRVLVERATIPTRLIDGDDVIVLQARGRNLTRDGQRYDNDYAFVIHFPGRQDRPIRGVLRH
jgi:ketosteroid isomerase-like protein